MKKEKENENEQAPGRIGISWGTGITAVVVLFVAATLGMVGYLVSLDYHMVSENYYEQAVNYQQHIERVERTQSLAGAVRIEKAPSIPVLVITFPSSVFRDEAKPEGTIQLYRPSDASLDRTVKLLLDKNGIQNVSTEHLLKGKWSVRINWTADGKNYYKEKQLFL